MSAKKAQSEQAEPSTEDTVFVSPTIGSGPEARIEIRCAGWAMTKWADSDGEPRIRDLDLAIKLGFVRPRKIREIIERLIKDGEISGVYMRPNSGRISKPNGGFEERTVNEYWLTEFQTLMVVMASRTDAARLLKQEMARVFVLVRRGLVAPPNAANDIALASAIQSLALTLTDIKDRLAKVEAGGVRAANDDKTNNGVIGKLKARIHIRAPMLEYTNLVAGSGSRSEFLSARAKGYDELRERLGLPPRFGFDFLPSNRLGDATNHLNTMKRRARDARDAGARTQSERQGAMPWANDTAKGPGVAKAQPRKPN